MTRTAAPPGPLSIEPPEMHEKQWEILLDPHRFKFARAGRRFRKTGVGIVQSLFGYHDEEGRKRPGAIDGGLIGWWVPSMTARYIASDWEPLKACADQIPGTRIEEANHRVILPSGGWVMMLTGENVDSGRGLGLDGAVLDEAQLLHPQLYHETIRATLIDKRGWGLFLFTPPRTGSQWIKDLVADRAQRPDWTEFHFRTSDNPAIDEDELADLTEEMSTLVRLVEVEAEWASEGAGMFRREWIQRWRPSEHGEAFVLGETEVPAAVCRRFSTVDIAWSLEERADYTVVSTWALTPARHLILLNIVRGHIKGEEFVPLLRRIFDAWDPGYFVLERDGAQLDIVKDAQRSGLPIREVRAQGQGKKEVRAWPAVARMESRKIWFPQASALPVLATCEEELVGFPAGEHDDFVDTFVYAVLHTAKAGKAAGF